MWAEFDHDALLRSADVGKKKKNFDYNNFNTYDDVRYLFVY